MKTSTRILSFLLIALIFLSGQTVVGQSILNPADTLVTYNPAKPPAIPAYGAIQKWVRTVRLSWNTTGFKAYIYNGCQFRLYFPLSYKPGVADGKLYPMMIFDHGDGEGGTVYDNEYSLFHGGQIFANAVATGVFDGYVLVMQTTGSWGPVQYAAQLAIINYMITNNKLDPFRITVNGLSAGGQGTWGIYLANPTVVAGIIPMSAVDISYTSSSIVNEVKFTPIWNIHGQLDGAPAPYTAAQVAQAMTAGGANYTDLDMLTQGHDTWDSTWSMPAFWPFLLKANCANPWTLFGRTQFCPGTPINVTIGLAAGFQAYQWRQNGVVMPAATSNTINVTTTGTYDARVERGGIWSSWSPVPVVISTMPPTVTPPITVSGLMSNVIPAPDGNTGVTLSVPTGYASYLWQKVGSTATISTANTLYATSPGNYIVSVTQQFGCSSNFSPPFTVVAANGPNAPDAASGLNVTTLSQTSLLLNWSQNPTPQNNETGFEIYQGTHTGGPYKLVAITGADVSNDTIKNLNAGAKYYYIVRAVDNTGASANSNEASGSTIADTQPPTAPGALTISGTTRSSIGLSWTASTDNIGVTEYDIYIDGLKSYVVPPTQTQFTLNNLQFQQSYALIVKAVDLAGNNSAPSNQVSAEPLGSGLTYKYYAFASTLSNLPNYSSLSPTLTGFAPNTTLTPATQANNFGFLFEGFLHVTVAGTYSFRTTSDDGSKLYLGTLNALASPYNFSATALVSNDGLHASTTVTSANVTLAVGVYPIAIAYMQGTGGSSLSVTYKTPSSGNSYIAIPNSAYVDAAAVNGTAPAAPSNLVATSLSYNKIGLQWKDNSTNEAGFEVWRSSTAATGYAVIGTVASGVTNYIDSTISASTRYYYEVRSINLYGQSAFALNYTEALWKFENNYVDSTGNGHTLTLVGSPVFDATNKADGAFSVKLSGTAQGLTINNTPNSFLQEAYAQRTIALWVKSSSTSGANRVIFDIGGSDNGLALVLNNTTLTAAVASANVRSSISTSYTSTGWNHIAVVYNGDSLLLYVNGVLAASTTSLSFHSLNTTTNGARIGETNGTNALNTTGNAFGGWIDDFGVYNTALGSDVINSLVNFTYAQSNTTTQPLPAIPAAPTGLSATAASSSSVNLVWTNNAVNATSYQVYRSANNDQNYVLWSTLPASAVSFSDAGLFADAVYYYEVRAVNAGGNSAFAPESFARTLDNLPVITKLPSEQARYGTTTVIPISATHVGGGTLVLSSFNLPAFASLTDNGNGTGSLSLSPAITDQNTYTNLMVIATDGFGGADTTKFNLAVNNNFAPVLNSIPNYTINEGDTLTIPLSGTDQNASDVLSLTATNLPAGYVLTQVSNGVATLFVHPGYAAAGVYNVQATINDNNGLSATATFVLTVNNKNPNTKILARFAYQDQAALGAPWNALLGATTTNLLDSTGNPTTVGLVFNPTYWWNTFNGGSSTGNNSGVYPDVVLQDYYWFGSVYGGPDVINGVVTGTDTSQLYDLTFFANSVYNGLGDNGTTTYTSGTQTVSLYVQNNQHNTVTIPNIKPAVDGTIPFSMGKAPGTQLGYVNAVVITKHYDDGTAPAGITALAAQNVPGQVQLSWTDSAYNATGYEVWRALTSARIFSLQNTVAGNTANSYIDSNITGNTAYIYEVRAVNTHGWSGFDSVSTTTFNRLPKIGAIANVIMKDTQSVAINVTTTDDPTAQLTLTASNLPPFATFTDNGNGTGVLKILPSAGTVGVYPNVKVTVTDALDSTASTVFSIAVTEPNVSSVYVNFTGGPVCPQPWNTLLTPPFSGTVMSNLLDDGGNPTGISATLLDGFNWFGNTGYVTGNSDGVYPVPVIQSFLYEPTTATRRVQISGLNNAKLYNFVFFNSQFDGTNGLTNFTINGQTVSLQADWNINKTVQINAIRPVNGVVTIGVAKATGAANAYINSIVIQGYDTTAGLTLNPTDLRSLGITQTTVKLQWQDRSAIETGYQVFRATDANGTYTLLATLPANSTTYQDTKLSKNTNYYYIVRAVNGSNFSNYSNVLAITTFSDAIYINVTVNSEAPSPPWNNLNQPGGVGTTWSNFIDSTGVPTSVGMLQTGEFAGSNSLGDTTGHNTGVYPDAVLFQQYVLFPGNLGAFQLSGLNLSEKYDLTFFGSENFEGGNNNTAYIVGNDTVFLNALDNTQTTVTMHGLTPNSAGQLNISMISYGASIAGWFTAMVIDGYTPLTVNAPAPPTTGMESDNTIESSAATAVFIQTPQGINGDTAITAYPNPFHQSFTLSVPADYNNQRIMVTLFDVSGKLVYGKEFDNLVQGGNDLLIAPGQGLTTTGVYFIKVTYANNSKAAKVFKLLKN